MVLKSNSSPWEPPRVQWARQRRGVSWSNLAHWLINLTGVHSRKGKVRKKGKVARSFFKEKKAGLLLPQPGCAAPRRSRVFGCLAAAALCSKVAAQASVHLTLLRSRANETVAYHKAPEVSVSGWVLPCTWHSESTCGWTAKVPAFFFFSKSKVGSDFLSIHPLSFPHSSNHIPAKPELTCFLLPAPVRLGRTSAGEDFGRSQVYRSFPEKFCL